MSDSKKCLDRAWQCLQEDKLDEAAELCSAVLRSAPRNARGLYLRAVASQRAGRPKEAAEDACQAARLRPDLPSVQLMAGSLLCRNKCFGRALAVYEKALDVSPGNVQYHLGAASALRQLGCGDQATAAFLTAASAAASADVGTQAQVQYKLGQHLRSMGDAVYFAQAAQAYARCLELDRGHVLAAFWLPATRKLAASTLREPHDGGYVAGPGEGSAAVDNAMETPATPASAPREYVVGLYNSYAETFDSHLQGALEYRTPTVIVESLRRLFPGRRWDRCLDLGCGTGLSGRAASSVCRRLVGVDLSPAMVLRAREKRVYHRLLVGEVTETVRRLSSRSESASEPGAGLSARHPRARWEVPAMAEEEGGAAVAAVAVGVCGDGGGTGQMLPGTTVAGEASVEDVESPAVGSEDELVPPTEVATLATLPSAPIVTGSGSCGGSSSDGIGGGDLILSCDVFVYVGDLRACFEAVRELVAGDQASAESETDAGRDPRREEPAAVFAFSAEAPPPEAADAGDSGAEKRTTADAANPSHRGYELQGTGRYSHSREYLEMVCRDTGFSVLASSDVILRKNAGVPVPGFVFVTEAAIAFPAPTS
ncbi:unnamed protein product [Ectocarpus sp. 6 AP-2014]